ncbi:putative non-specific serine/threonine protein kinase [Medicago truncatula]|uniref:Putative non-specific serine/threonine protein kinase n=1 Tax=Medicago truncatula TaxID=3880 RepID=A0A396H0M8_MEDTR|nr:putative non-specific serine/threonine protein kinase [Medicago truncatula]
MFRYWENDSPRYLEIEYPQSVSSDFGDHLNYLNNTIPNYTAPETVYLTARNYGKYVTEDYNVTWNFEVDSSFTYMVRLHFCEFDPNIINKGDRMFQIFIDDNLVEELADVIRWSNGRMVPVHKDYGVTMYSQNGSYHTLNFDQGFHGRASFDSGRSHDSVKIWQRGILKLSKENCLDLSSLSPIVFKFHYSFINYTSVFTFCISAKRKLSKELTKILCLF